MGVGVPSTLLMRSPACRPDSLAPDPEYTRSTTAGGLAGSVENASAGWPMNTALT